MSSVHIFSSSLLPISFQPGSFYFIKKMFGIRSQVSLLAVRSLVRGELRQLSTQAAVEGARVKHRIPVKRASKLLNELKKEEFDNLKNGRQWPFFQSGDAIEIEKLPFMSAPSGNIIKGVVIGISNKASDTNIRLLNVRVEFS